MKLTPHSLLDNDIEARGCQMAVKERLHEVLHLQREFTEEDHRVLNP